MTTAQISIGDRFLAPSGRTWTVIRQHVTKPDTWICSADTGFYTATGYSVVSEIETEELLEIFQRLAPEKRDCGGFEFL